MKFQTSMLVSFAFLSLAASAGGPDVSQDRALGQAAETGKAPPQYVHLAFDGSKSLFMWEHTVDMAEQLTRTVQAKNPNAPAIRFTYFINTPYFMTSENRNNYVEPTKGRGKICISWGDEATELESGKEKWRTEERAVDLAIKDPNVRVLRRMELMNRAFDSGHELASHANSHCYGDGWSPSQWMSEMDQFYSILFNYPQISKLGGYLDSDEAKAKYLPHFTKDDIRGFRAPQLAVAPGMWAALQKHGIAFDTSLDDSIGAWPRRKKDANGNDMGIWLFPLTNIPIISDVKPGKSNLSMDYNFYTTQSGAEPNVDPAAQKRFEEETYQSYLKYFAISYLGNRSPIHIGHHFSRWNEGAYWRAFQRIATKICGLPDVRCVPYLNLASYLDGVKAKQADTGKSYISSWADNDTLGRDSLRAQYGASIEPQISQITGWARLRNLDRNVDADDAVRGPASSSSPELAVYVSQDDDGKNLVAKSRLLLPDVKRPSSKSPVAGHAWFIDGKAIKAFAGKKMVEASQVLAYLKKQGMPTDALHVLEVGFNDASGNELGRFETKVKFDLATGHLVIKREGDHSDM